MPDTEDEGRSPDYNEFSKLICNAQQIADDTKKAYVFMWRGYKACISSQLPKLTSFEIDRRFSLAMDSINKRDKENEVIFCSKLYHNIMTNLIIKSNFQDFFEHSQVQPVPTKEFKKPIAPVCSSSGQSSSFSSRASSDSLISEEDRTQIPETQFDMTGKSVSRWRRK